MIPSRTGPSLETRNGNGLIDSPFVSAFGEDWGPIRLVDTVGSSGTVHPQKLHDNVRTKSRFMESLKTP